MKINKLKGVLDYYGDNMKVFNFIKNQASKIVETYGYHEVLTPIIEPSEVFLRTVGDETDIVGKEMYLFKDRGDREIALKPESTASIMRMVVENKLYIEPGLKKYYYLSPNFRYDRPQAGRYRQFYQFGVEAMGEESPYLDAEIIQMAYEILTSLGLKNIQIQINTLGSSNTRANYNNALKEYFRDKLDALCDDCQRRYTTNTLRMLDCKKDHDNPVLLKAPKIQDYLSDEDELYFKTLLKTLDTLNVPYLINPTIVRGLDYYTNDIFEFIYTNPLSPIDGLALGGGGRYNNLAGAFDGPEVKSIGFGFGMERLMQAITSENIEIKEDYKTIVVITLSDSLKQEGIKLANKLRKQHFLVELDYKNNNLKPQFKLCDRLNPALIIIVGEDEMANNMITVKWPSKQMQKQIKINELDEIVKNLE